MGHLPEKHFLNIRPKEYLVQGFNHCGAYTVKGILSAYDKDTKSNPKDYHLNWLGKITGTTLGINYWVKVLRNNGLNPQLNNARSNSSKNKIILLKSILFKDNPIMIYIGNGYDKTLKYNVNTARVSGHWISLWGYDDKEKVFYIYDSSVEKESYDKNIPIGNIKRSYDAVIRDWGTALFPWPWKYIYIKVRN